MGRLHWIQARPVARVSLGPQSEATVYPMKREYWLRGCVGVGLPPPPALPLCWPDLTFPLLAQISAAVW